MRRLAVVSAVLVPLLGAGCSAGSEPAATASSPNLSAPSQNAATPSDKDSGKDIEAAYSDFWVVSLTIDDKPEETWRDELGAVMVEPQLSITLDAVRSQAQAGITVYGDVTARIVSVEVAGDAATVVDCQDASRTGQADAETGDRKTVGVERNPVNAELKRVDGQWKVAQVSFPGGTC
ncbi:hypothetical protein BAY61_18195 [Prauserella marina]|nr:hypothetical protein BAY61_18195 [Prauserella marina]